MSEPSAPAHAGVHFPPPLIYVGGIVVGWLLNRWRAITITAGSSTGRLMVGAIFVAIYLILFGAAFIGFRRARTTLIPNRPASAVVTSGIYGITRNPMYVSLIALYLGVTLFINSWWPVFLLPLVILLVDRTVIAREERYLIQAFPAEYGAYRERVRRWL